MDNRKELQEVKQQLEQFKEVFKDNPISRSLVNS